MNSTTDQAGPVPAEMAAFVSGALGREFGLGSDDLRLGLEVARTQMQRGALQDALRTYVALVLCEPANPDIQVGLANCALQLGEFHFALQAASAVVALAPRDPRGFLLSGRSCLGLGLIAEARDDLGEAARVAREGGDEILAREADNALKALDLGAQTANA